MSRINEYLATLHVIAAGDGPEEGLKRAVGETFTRFVNEAQQARPQNQNAVRVWVVGLQDALTAAMLESKSERFQLLRGWVHELAIEWLRSN